MLDPLIRKQIELRFGQAIRYSKDCESLARDIRRSAGDAVSPTTIKRLFGFAKAVDSPRLITLDAIAKYMGYPDWTLMQEEMKKQEAQAYQNMYSGIKRSPSADDVFQLKQHITLTLHNQSIDIPRTVLLTNRFSHHPEIIPFITEMISIADRLQDARFLQEVYSLPGLFTNTRRDPVELYYVSQWIGSVLRRNPAMAEAVTESFVSHKMSRFYFMEWFVDEDHLNGYFGKMMDAYVEHPLTRWNDRLFYYTLKHRACRHNGDNVGRHHWFVKVRDHQSHEALHEILAGRKAGICIAEMQIPYSADSPYAAVIMHYCRQMPYTEAISFMFFLLRELLATRRDDWIQVAIAEFDAYQHEPATAEKTHWTLKMENKLLVYRAYNALLLKRPGVANKLLEQTDTHFFDTSIYDQVMQDYRHVKSLLER